MGPPALVCVVILLALLAHARTLDSVHVNKCCKSSEVLDKYRRECQNSTVEDWTVKYLTMVPRKFRAGLPTNWKIREDARPPCDSLSSFFQRLHSFVAFENGSLFITEIGTLVPPASYCMDYDVVLVCNGESDTLIQQGERVNRCCGRNAVYSIDKRRCDYFKHDRTMIVPNGTVLVDSLPGCTDYALAGPYNESLVLANGSLKSTAFDTVLPSDSYCIEYLEESNDDVPSVLACTQYIVQSVKPKPTDFRFILYPIALSLSVIFLAATLIASFLMPASHHVLHWRCQTNYVLCLLLGDVVLCIVQFSGSGLADLGALCTILAFSMHFLFLSAFFWLNTMCFNIWWTFRDLRPQNLEKSQERCRLRLYVVYACGFPAIIALIGLILDLVGDETAFYQPGFGKHKCWFQGNMEIMLYFFIPVGILLAVNLALFVATARELTCGLWKRELVKSTTERAALGRVCLKLVIVMGVFWIADIISWIVGGPHEYWYSTDIFNCLQGVFIFIVVGCQPQVLAAVKRYWCWRRGSTVETAGTTNHHSSTSQGQPSMGETMCNHSVSNNTKSIALETSC